MTRNDALVEVTLETVQGRMLLRPSEEANRVILGVIGRALSYVEGVALHNVVALSNHMYLLLTVRNVDVIAKFMNRVSSGIARRAAEHHNWDGRLWARRYRMIEVLDDVAAVGRMRDFFQHGVGEGFFRSPADWPGIHSVEALLHDKPLVGVWRDESALHAAERRGQDLDPSDFDIEYEVPLTPLPCWADLSDDERRERVQTIIDTIVQEAQHNPGVSDDIAAVKRRICSVDPHRRPEKTKHTPSPPCHATRRERREQYLESRALFHAKYRVAAARHRRRRQRLGLVGNAFSPQLGFIPASSP